MNYTRYNRAGLLGVAVPQADGGPDQGGRLQRLHRQKHQGDGPRPGLLSLPRPPDGGRQPDSECGVFNIIARPEGRGQAEFHRIFSVRVQRKHYQNLGTIFEWRPPKT